MGKRIKVRTGKGQSMIGFLGGLVFCFLGFFIAIPTAGLFGVFWTLIAVVITVANGINAFTDKAIISHEIIINESDKQYKSSAAPEDSEQRLQEIQALYDKGLITAEEYRQKRKNIIDSI